MKFRQMIGKTRYTLDKHSPKILLGAGILGLGFTAYLIYKAAPEMEDLLEDYEDETMTIPKQEMIKRSAKILAPAVVAGTTSVCFIILAYSIQEKRIQALASAVAAVTLENNYVYSRLEKDYGEKVANNYKKGALKSKVDAEGREIMKQEDFDTEANDELGFLGRWFDRSAEYTTDHEYNKAWIEAVEKKMQNKLFMNGYLILNDVLDALGFDRTPYGAAMGWGISDAFELEKQIVWVVDKTHENGLRPQIYISWPKVGWRYDEIAYSGRYAQ